MYARNDKARMKQRQGCLLSAGAGRAEQQILPQAARLARGVEVAVWHPMRGEGKACEGLSCEPPWGVGSQIGLLSFSGLLVQVLNKSGDAVDVVRRRR